MAELSERYVNFGELANSLGRHKTDHLERKEFGQNNRNVWAYKLDCSSRHLDEKAIVFLLPF